MNYFQLFSLPTAFRIDNSVLASNYRELQKQYHPDKFVMLSDAERLAAMQKSTEINDAYQTLKSSASRAQYMLMLSGLDIALEQRTLQDTEFLMQQMMWREQLESFGEEDEDEIEAFAAHIVTQVQALEVQIEAQLQDESLEATANSVRKLKFMLKLQVEIEQLEEKLFD